MTPERQCVINGFRIEECIFAGDFYIYVDFGLVEGTYEQACARASKGIEPKYVKR